MLWFSGVKDSFQKSLQIETQHFGVKLHPREVPLHVMLTMIRKLKPTRSSLNHLGEAGGR